MVSDVFSSRNDPALLEAVEQQSLHWPVEVIIDDPTLAVSYYFMAIQNPSWLAARDNWFERYAQLLKPHLQHPLRTTVFTFALVR